MTLDDPTGIDWTLLARYFGKVCTSEEAQLVERWVAAKPERAREIELLRAVWDQASHIPFERRSQQALDRIRARVQLTVTNRPRAPRFAVGVVSPKRWMSVAAGIAAALIMVGSWLGWQRLHPPSPVTPAHEFATGPAQRMSITLVDGTRVTLGSASRLVVLGGFGVKARTVSLEGDAYFAIAHDARLPFRVHTTTTTTEDLGTALVIHARSRDSVVEIMVVEGKVALFSDTLGVNHGVALTRGQLARVARSGLVSVAEGIDVATMLAWMEGKLEFHKTRLADVCEALERWYDVRIALPDSTSRNVPVTASFTDLPVDDALRTLAELLGLRYERNDSMARLVVRSARGGSAK